MDAGIRNGFADFVRFWERGRIIYNLALVTIIIGWIILTWPHFAPPVSSEAAPFLVFLFVIANLCYSAVYLVEIPLQHSARWIHWRWALWLAGMLFAFLFLNYWIADEIYPYVR